MLTELSHNAQITIPKEILRKLGLSEGDKLNIFEKDGAICILPVAIYPAPYVQELQKEIDTARTAMETNNQPVFSTVDALFDYLEKPKARTIKNLQ